MGSIKTALAALSVLLAWVVAQIGAHPKSVLIAWAVSLAVVAWVF